LFIQGEDDIYESSEESTRVFNGLKKVKHRKRSVLEVSQINFSAKKIDQLGEGVDLRKMRDEVEKHSHFMLNWDKEYKKVQRECLNFTHRLIKDMNVKKK